MAEPRSALSIYPLAMSAGTNETRDLGFFRHASFYCSLSSIVKVAYSRYAAIFILNLRAKMKDSGHETQGSDCALSFSHTLHKGAEEN